MSMLKKYIGGALAGISIAIGGTVFLLCENRVVGALMFCVGLFSVCVFGFDLFTGKVCYVFENDKGYALSLLPIWLGNLTGAVLIGLIEKATRLNEALYQKAAEICAVKLSQGYISAFLLAVLCDIMIYIAVEGYKTIPQGAGKLLAIIFGVSVFVLCGFEHCVANMYYFTVGNAWSGRAIIYLLIMTLGNAVGGVLLPLLRKAATIKAND